MAKNYTNPLDEYYDLIGKQAGQQTSSDPLEEYYRLVSGDTTAKQLEQNAAGGMLERRYNHWANAENRYMQMVRNFNTSISDRMNAGNQGVYQNKKTYEQAEREINYYKWVDEAMKRYRQGMPDRLKSGFSPEIDKAYQDEFTKQSQGLGFEEYLNAISDAVTSQREYYGQFRDAGDYNRQRMVAGQQPQLPDKGYKWWEEALRTPGSQAQTYEQMQDKPDGRRFDGPDSKRYQESQDKLGDLLPGETPPIDDKKEPGAVLPDGTRRIASTDVSDVVYQQRGPRVLPDAVKHPDLQGVSLTLDPQNRPLDKQISYLEELKRWQTGQATRPDLKKMAAEKLLPGMGKYKLDGMGGAEIKGILETEKNKLASGNGNPHMVQGIKDYYYNNTSQGTRDYMAEVDTRLADLNGELERLAQAEIDFFNNTDAIVDNQDIAAIEAHEANVQMVSQVKAELETLKTLKTVVLPIQETYLRLGEENAELRKDPDFLAKTFFEPEKGYDAILAKALDDTDFYSQMEWRDKLPNSTAEYIYQSIAGKMNADPNALGYDDNYALAAGHADIEGRGLDKLTPDEKHTFLYKYNVQGPAKAMEYLDDLRDVLLYRRAIDNEEAWRAYASKNGWTATLATVASVPLNMVNAVMSPVRMVHAATGGSPYDRLMDTQRMTNVYREEGAKMLGGAIDFVIPGINKNAGELIYGVATSMADMWAAAGLGAMVGAPNAVSFILGSSAASATLLSAMESGKNPGQAVAQSFLAGAIEVATEAISWSKLNKLGYAAKKSMMQNVARNIAVQAATEGMEEGFSAVGNMAVSVLMYGLERSDFGDLQKAVQADALKAGETLTEDQVFTRALLRFAQDMGGDILAGMMSGGLNAAGMMAFSQEHRSDLVGKYINDQKGIVHETAAKVDLYGGERIRDAGRAVEEKIWGRPVSEMTLEERRAEMNQIEKRLRKGAATMTTQEQVDTSRRMNELTDYSTLPEQQAQTRGEERAEEAQLPPQIETREERMAKVEELSRYEAENTERLTPQEKRQIAQQMKTLMADVDSLPTLKQANIQAQQALGARLDAAVAMKQESIRKLEEAKAKKAEADRAKEEAISRRDAAIAELGRTKQVIAGNQLSRSAELDARVAAEQTQDDGPNLHAYRLLKERMDAVRAENQADAPQALQELQSIAEELGRLSPKRMKELRDIAAEYGQRPQADAETEDQMSAPEFMKDARDADAELGERPEAPAKMPDPQAIIQYRQALQESLDSAIAEAADTAVPTEQDDENAHAYRLLQERMDAIRALPEERMGTQEVRQELQDITAELDRLEPRKAPERPQDPASEAIAMPPVSEAIEPRKAPERPQDPATERIDPEPQTGTGYTGLAREYGMAGLRTSDLESVIGKDNLTDAVLQAHKEGVFQAKVEARMRTEEILGRREAASKRGYLKSISEQEATANGVNTIGKMSPAIRKASTALRVIAESTGINVVLFESPINDKGEHTGKQGWFDSAKRTLYLDVKAGYGNEEATMRAAGHELTHVIQKFAPEFYENTYKPAVIDALYEGNEGTMLDLVQEQIRIAKENGKTMTESQAMFEVIADASERMLMGDQATITGLVEQNPDLFKRVKNWIDNFVNSLRRAYTILKADSSAAKVLEGTYERFKGIQEMWWNGLQDAALNIRGQQEAMPISAYEQSRDAAREAKLQRIGAGLINPAMYEPVDYRQYAPKPQAKPIEPTIRQWEAFEKAKAEDDFGGMFAAAIDEEAIENMTPEDLDALLSLPGADKLAEEGKKTTPTTAKKPDKVLSDGVVPVDKLKGFPVKFRNLVKKWAGNEYVNVDINDMSDQNAQNFVDWAKKWYNYGREGNWPELGIFDDNDLNFPPFLQNTFFNQGKADAEKVIKPIKPVEAGGKPDVRGTEDYDTGGIPEVEERLPGQGQADEPSTGETIGAGPQAGGVLEEVSSEDVQQPGGPGGTARDSDGGIRPAVRDDVTTDAPGTTRGPGVGSGERGDLRNPGRDINDDVVQAAAEAAKRREAEANKGKNYVIPPEGLDLPGGQKARFNLNVEAIKIAKDLEAEGRIATPEEQQALARYVGWGGIPDAFDARGRVKEGWEAENQTLKELLSEEEYEAARRSTTNAHYTEIGIIRSMYDALKKWGFKGGYVLEPSSGIGNFIGAAPSFGKQTRWTAVELDSTTALIAKHLYPQASVHHAGFQDVQLPDNYFDLAISNVPFSETGPVDKKYPKFLRSNLHNYFFVKSMDKVRPGGLVMFITSRFTMDSANSSFRDYMARHADLVGAVRLPDTAFKQNANTEVVTDLLVFKKRQPNTEYTGQPFAHAGVQIFDSPNSSYGARHNVNEYFLNNPDMVLGTPTISRGMYSANTLTYKAIEGKALTEQLSEALSKINVKVDYVERTADPMKAADEVVKASSRTKNNGYEVKDGKVYLNKNGTLDLADDINQSPDKLARVTTMLGLRDLRKQLLHAQLQGKEKAETDRLRKELNKQYDAFVKKYGFLNSKENARLMYDDPDSFSLLALEDYRPAEDGKPEQAIKTDIFVKDTIASATRATSAKNPEEALAISINELGYLDPERMGELLSVTPDQAEALLLEQQLAFKDEDGALIPAPVYLSGRVRSKLIIAKQMAAVDKSYQANVEALESVIPVDVPVEDISLPLGATWIPTEYYEGFIRHILGLATYQGQVKVQMNPLTSSYKIELNSAAKRSIDRRADIKYGAGDWSFLKILDKIMNGGSMKSTYKDQDGRTQTDKATTAAINEKAEQIKSEFVQWIKSDPDLAAPIARLYNDTFNDTVEATFDGENLTIDGANPSMPLKPHQKAVIQRALQSGGNMLIAHATGAGKTAEMAGIAMKMRQLGILKKPLFVVPKPVATQWGQEFMTFFPNAKVLVPQDADYEARNRKTFINKIISNDYDAVILSYEMFEAVPLSGEAMRSFYQAQIDEAMEALQAAKDDDTEGDRYYSRAKPLNKDWTVKQIEKQLEKLQKRIEELDSKNKRDEDNVDFEELGVDGLFVDEAHNFKNLRVYTHLQNVAGINTSAESGRAFDLLAKVQHMQKLNGGKGVFFATATPVMNTLGELFVMQRYLMPNVMRDKGIYNFDAWVNAFASVMKELSIDATGTGYKVKDTLSKFVNLPELQTMFRSFADVIPVVEGLKIPEVKGGKPFIHEVEPTEFQKEYVKELADRANNIKGRPEKGDDNMLKITTEGRKVALSGRLVDVTQDIEQDGKLAVTAKEIVRVYKESKKHKGTQLVFMDIGVPGANEALNMYAALKDMLVAAGIPSAQIKTIYDAKNEVDRKKLFRQVNDGTVRVLMGSTGKMGTGVNVQQRVAAMHHIDVPYRPGDLTQRNGRGRRQGNLYTDLDGIEIHYYVTKGTFDSYMWQKVQTKSAFIEQLMTNENKLRESEGESMNLTAAEVTAIASGNPMILEKFALENDLMKLAALKDQHDNDITHAKKQIHSNKTQIASLKKQIEAVKKDIAQKVDTKGDKFSMVVGNTTYKDRVKAGEALIAMYSKASKGTFPAEGLKAGKLGGFNIVLQSQGGMLLQTNRGVVALINPESASGTISRLENSLNFDGQVEGLEMLVSKAEADIAAYQEALEKPFERQEEYTQKKTRYDEIMAILAPNKNEGAETSDEETAEGFDGMESSEKDLDYSFRRLAADDFLQEREDDPGRIEDRTILAERLDALQYSARDNTGRALSQEQQEFFKDSKVRDGQGRLLKVYHGTKAHFSTFRTEYGAFFTASKKVADGFAEGVGAGAYYLDFKTPLVLDAKGNRWDALPAPAEMGRSNAKYKMTPDEEAQYTEFRKLHEALQKLVDDGLSANDYTKWHEANPRHGELYPAVTKIIQKQAAYEEANSSVIAADDLVEWAKEQGKYDGVIIKNVREGWASEIVSDDYIALRSEQIKSVDNQNPTTDPDIRYSDRDPSRLSNRERLVGALETVALNDYEKDIIKRYKDRLASITKDAELLKATNAQIRELSFAPGPRDMDQLIKLKNNKQTLLNKIARQDARLLKIEAAQPLANLVNLEKRRAERALKQQRADLHREYKQEVQERVREVRQKGAEKLAKYKQNQEAREYKAQITALVKNMSEKLVNPSKNGYYPEALKGPLGDVLKSINEQSKRSLAGGDSTKADREFYDRLNKLLRVLSRINQSQQSAEAMSEDYAELAGFVDLPAGFVERMAELADIMEQHMKMNTGEYVLNTMTAEELKALLKMLTALDRSLETINQLHIQGVFAHVDQMGKYSIQHGDNMKSKLHREGKIDKFLNWDNTLPVYAFERMGKAGQSLFDGFRRGMDKQAKLAQEIVEFSETTFTPAEAREWGKQIITVTLDGNEVRLTAAHLMELYAHNRREQSRGHIYGAGIKVNNFKVGTTTYAHRGDVTLPSEITAAFEQLTDRQKEVALALQTFMSKKGGGWIDEVNMARFGAKQLDDENDTYWPIKSVPQNIDTKMEAPEGNPLYRILNMSFMKPLTKGANNQIVISNIFDTFASHMADVIQLNAFALPVLDAIKWFNYRQSYKNPETGQKYVSSVRSSIRNAFGESGEKYVTRMLLDLNGSRMTGGGEEAAMTMLRHYNRSVVAANLRVALLQPTSIVRALNVIDARYLGMGALTNLAHLRRNIREMEKHSGIAIWKQLGFYDVNISRSIQDLIKRDNPLMDRLTGKTMVLPQTMDRITWAAIWDASKRQAAAENPGLNKNSEEYWDKVKALFDTVIYKTQVVDTMLTRSEYMRRPSFVAKWTSSFMSEPTMTYNILSSQVHTFNDDVASGMSRGAAWRKNGRKITRTATAYALSVALVTMAEALSGAWRDDDEYTTFMEKLAKAYKNNLIDNLMPLNLPIINDLWQITKRFVGQTFGVDLWGFTDASPMTQGVQLMYDGFTAVTKVMNGEGKNMTLYGAGYKLLQGISAVTGHPFSSMTREVVDLWNNTAGKMYPEYRVVRYKPSGFEALFKALQAGDNERSAEIREILERQGVDDKKVYGGLRDQAREAYKEGNLTFEGALKMLEEQEGSPDKGLYWTVKEWEARREADDWSTEFTYSRYDAYHEAILTGTNLKQLMQELIDNYGGDPKKAQSAIASEITNHWKEQYIELYNTSRAQAANLKARLMNAYALLGYDREKKSKDIDAWLK